MQKLSPLSRIMLILWSIGVLLMLAGCYFLIWKANGEKFFPLDRPLTPVHMWNEEHQLILHATLFGGMIMQLIGYAYLALLGFWGLCLKVWRFCVKCERWYENYFIWNNPAFEYW